MAFPDPVHSSLNEPSKIFLTEEPSDRPFRHNLLIIMPPLWISERPPCSHTTSQRQTFQTTTFVWVYFLQMTCQLLTMKTMPKCVNQVNKLWRWKDTIIPNLHFIIYSNGVFGIIGTRKFIYIIFHIFYHSIFACLVLIWRQNIISHSPNPSPLLLGKAIVSIESKDRVF